jgi:hypothetical protein
LSRREITKQYLRLLDLEFFVPGICHWTKKTPTMTVLYVNTTKPKIESKMENLNE